MGGASLGPTGRIVVDHEANREVVALLGEAVRRRWRNDKQIPGASDPMMAADGLRALAGKVKNQLGEVVAMRGDLGMAVPVQLQFPQHEPEGVNLDFLDQDRTPGEHGVGFVLVKVGFVLTQARSAD